MEKSNEKVWGIYNTYKEHQGMDKLSEIDLWNSINNLGAILFWAQHDASKPWGSKVTEQELLDLQYNIEYLVYSTRKYGVEFANQPSAKKHVERSESYDSWFRFWHDHFDSMGLQEYSEFVDAKKAGEDITKYLPEESWQDYYKKQKSPKTR